MVSIMLGMFFGSETKQDKNDFIETNAQLSETLKNELNKMQDVLSQIKSFESIDGLETPLGQLGSSLDNLGSAIEQKENYVKTLESSQEYMNEYSRFVVQATRYFQLGQVNELQTGASTQAIQDLEALISGISKALGGTVEAMRSGKSIEQSQIENQSPLIKAVVEEWNQKYIYSDVLKNLFEVLRGKDEVSGNYNTDISNDLINRAEGLELDDGITVQTLLEKFQEAVTVFNSRKAILDKTSKEASKLQNREDSIAEELQTAENLIKEKEEEIQALTLQNETIFEESKRLLVESADKIKILEAKNESLSNQYEELKKDKENAEKQVYIVKQREAGLRSQVQDLEPKLSEIRKELETKKQEIFELEQKTIADLKAAQENFENQKREIELNFAQQKQSYLDNLNETRRTTIKDINDKHKQEKQELETRYKQLNQQNTKLLGENQKQKLRLQELETELSAIGSTVGGEATSEEEGSNNATLVRILERATKKLAALETELDSTRKQLKDAKTKLDEANEKIKSLIAQLAIKKAKETGQRLVVGGGDHKVIPTLNNINQLRDKEDLLLVRSQILDKMSRRATADLQRKLEDVDRMLRVV